MTPKSLDRLAKVHPVLRAKIMQLAENCAKLGITIEVVQGLRTFAEQDGLFAQGRDVPGARVTNAPAGHSNHNYGLAIDFAPFINGQPDWKTTKTYTTIGVLGERLGLEWGGRWKNIKDQPHLQLPGLDIDQCLKIYRTNKNSVSAVWREMDKIIAANGSKK